MYKNYLLQDGKEYYRGTYKTPTTAIKYAKLDAKRYQEKLDCLNIKKNFIIITKQF